MRSLLVSILLLVSIQAAAQILPAERAGTILVRISPSRVSTLREAFTRVRPSDDQSFSHTDIHRAQVSDDSAIEVMLGLPDAFHGLHLKPYLPTHSIAFEDIRERSNPELFIAHAAPGSQRGRTIGPQSALNTELCDAEEKLSRWFVLTYVDSISPERAARFAKKSTNIELAEPRYYRYPLFTPNDPLIGQQYGLGLIHAFEAWDVVRCDSTMLVADADNGTDWTHEDLSPIIYINPGEIGVDSNGVDKRANGVDDDGNGFIDDWHGWDFDGTNGDTPDNDTRGSDKHGTHTAGLLAAAGNNGKGIAGVAFGARLLPIKISADDGSVIDFGFEGIIYAADMHAKVVNCSWGGSTFSSAEQEVIDYAYAKDCAVVVAAGNHGIFEDFYPGSYHHVLDVAAVDQSSQLASYTDYNTHVSVSAPGGAGPDVLSTIPVNAYGNDYGTSMACPQACGVVALVRQKFPWMTAGQAMQQVRATSDPLTVASTDDRKDLVGHGLVNALKAVSDTNAHAVRIEGFTIADDFGHGEFLPGESGGIVVKAVNYLKPVRNLLARVEVFQGGDAIDLRSSIVPFGQAQMLDTLRNIQAAFRIHVHDTVPQNTTVIFKLTFFDTIVGYGPDVDYFSFVINPTYLDLNASNIIATFSSKGTIGFNDVVTNRDGTGFIWQKAPASIESFGKSLLFQGGIMIGTNATQVVDVVQDQGAFAGDEDLAPGDVVHYVSPVDHFNAIQELACRYSDSIADLSVHVGVNVTQRAYEFNTGLGSNAIIVNYVFRKTGGSQLTDSSAVALFTDWDVGLSGALNIARFDSASQTAITYRVESGYPFAGMKIISPLPAGASVQYHAIRNNGSEGGINTYNGFSKQAKWRAMTEWYPQTGPADVSHTLGLKNVPMASQDSIVMTVVFALAEDPEVLKRTIDVATVLWDAPLGVTPSAHTAGLPSLHVYPDPFRSTLHLNWNVPSSGTAHVALLDVLGRTVMSGDFEGTVCDLSSLHLSPGPYVAQVLVGDRRMSVPVVCTR